VQINAWVAQVGPHVLEVKDLDAVNSNPFFSPDPDKVPELEIYMDALRKEGDSIGARVTVTATGVSCSGSARRVAVVIISSITPCWARADSVLSDHVTGA